MFVGIFISFVLFLSIFSWGFIDPGFQLQSSLTRIIFEQRPIAAAIFAFIIGGLFISYIQLIRSKIDAFLFVRLVGLISLILVVSYPALTHDLFNYITTAKVTFFHVENPYVVMPIEIPSEPFLAFTRAANKLALYGPLWILITGIPWLLSGGNIWLAIISFKSLTTVSYLLVLYLIYKETKNIKNVVFFGLNPLVIIEVLVSGHNDLVMMALAIAGIHLWFIKSGIRPILGIALVLASTLIKGATLAIVPLFAFVKTKEQFIKFAAAILFVVFVIVGPLREELYPWYALWFLSLIALLPIEKYRFVRNLSIVFTIGLELRHVPYLYMGYYEGVGPMLRIAATVTPMLIFILYEMVKRKYR